MGRWQIERTVAGQLLAATHHVLDHLGRFKMREEGLAAVDPELVRDTYGGVRWLRNHLQRRLSDAGNAQEIVADLTLADQNLLASCAMFEIVNCDLLIADVDRDPVSVNQARALQACMAEWVIRLATRIPVRIPGPERLGWHSTKALAVEASVRRKLHPGPELPGSNPVDPALFLAEPEDVEREAPAIAADIERMFDGYQADAAQDPVPSGPPPTLLPLDLRRIREPRLRRLATLDLRAFERSIEANDQRLAMVHLYSVFEAVVVDFALERQSLLQLQGTADSWSIEFIVHQILGHDFGPLDRSNLELLMTARDNVRPALLFERSSGLTTSSALDGARAFANHVFQRCGMLPPARGAARR